MPLRLLPDPMELTDLGLTYSRHQRAVKRMRTDDSMNLVADLFKVLIGIPPLMILYNLSQSNGVSVVIDHAYYDLHPPLDRPLGVRLALILPRQEAGHASHHDMFQRVVVKYVAS